VPESAVTDGHVNKFVLNDPSSPHILLEAHASLESGPRPRPSTHIHMPPRLSLLNTRQHRVAFTSLQILRALTRFQVEGQLSVLVLTEGSGAVL
jgi:hypothetical protein